MSAKQLFETMKEQWDLFEQEHHGASKAAKARARKAIGELRKHVTAYRKASIEESK